MRIVLEVTERDQTRDAAGVDERSMQANCEGGIEITVVCAVEPERWNPAFRAIVCKGGYQCRLPLAWAAVGSQAAGKIDQAAYAGDGAGAQRQCRQSAVRLACHQQSFTIDPGLLHQVIDDALDIVCLRLPVRFEVAAVVDVPAAGVGKASAHRDHHGIAALDELAADGNETVAFLQAWITARLAVIHDQCGKGAVAWRLEQRGFEFDHATGGGHWNPNHLFDETCIREG